MSEKVTILHHLQTINYKNHHPVLFSIKKGGVASGMRHTETNTYDVKRLLHVKGKKRVIAKEVSHTSQWLCNISGTEDVM